MKNFFLKQATKHTKIDKIKNHVDYLIDENRPAHFNSKITPITEDVSKNYHNIRKELESYDMKQKENGGGRPPRASTTYILSMPEDLIHPTNEEWTKIYNQTIDNFCDFMNENQRRKEDLGFKGKDENKRNVEKYNAIRLDSETFKRNSVAVIHNEEQAHQKASHIHIITSNVQNGDYLKMLNQTAGQSFIKKSYDLAVKNVLGLDPLDYVPKCDRLTEEQQQELDAADELQFQERMKSEGKKDRKRSRRKPTAPPYVCRELENERKQTELENNKTEFEQDKNIFDNKKTNTIKKLKLKNQDLNKKDKKIEQKSKTAKKSLSKINDQIENNQKWLYNIIKSDVFTTHIEKLRSLANTGLDFYVGAKQFVTGIEKINEEFLNDLNKSNPDWLEKEEKRIKEKQQNRHSGGVFEMEGEEEEKEKLKEEIEKVKKESLFDLIKKPFRKSDKKSKI